MTTDLERRVAELEAIVKKYLPCQHQRIEQSWSNGKDFVCSECDAEWSYGENPPEYALGIVKI